MTNKIYKTTAMRAHPLMSRMVVLRGLMAEVMGMREMMRQRGRDITLLLPKMERLIVLARVC